MAVTLAPTLYFSYSQFFIYDRSVRLPGCDWTDQHHRQGFARRNSTVNVSTLFEYGHADVTVHLGAYEPTRDYQRAIALPFRVTSGHVIIEGPEEFRRERQLMLSAGDYRLVAAQRITGEEREAVDLFFESVSTPVRQSVILIADDDLNPPAVLVEIAGVAGEEDRYPCPCCGFVTLLEQPPGTFAICPVCFWEDDNVQYQEPSYRGGANDVSLIEARENFIRYGVSDERFKEHVRPPLADES